LAVRPREMKLQRGSAILPEELELEVRATAVCHCFDRSSAPRALSTAVAHLSVDGTA